MKKLKKSKGLSYTEKIKWKSTHRKEDSYAPTGIKFQDSLTILVYYILLHMDS